LPTGEHVHVLDDHPRVEHRLAALHHQAGHLAQRVGGQDVVARPDVLQHELVVELLFRQHDTHLADVGTGEEPISFMRAVKGVVGPRF
jgi:hypothetical protein